MFIFMVDSLLDLLELLLAVFTRERRFDDHLTFILFLLVLGKEVEIEVAFVFGDERATAALQMAFDLFFVTLVFVQIRETNGAAIEHTVPG